MTRPSPRPHLTLTLALGVSMLMVPALLRAQPDYSGLQGGAAPTRPEPGVAYPLLDFRSPPKLMGAESEVWITENGADRKLGTLKQGAWASLAGMYSFRREDRGPVLAAVDWKLATLDPGAKFVLWSGDRRQEIGRVRQRVIGSIGTGLDVYKKSQPPLGYVDEKVGRNPVGFALDPVMYGSFTNKYYVFQSISGSGRNAQRRDLFAFVSANLQHFGPAGLFIDTAGKPLLAVKGSWWQSQLIFDMVTTRLEAEGTAGKVTRGAGVLIGVLAGDDDLVKSSTQGASDEVRNPTGYIGAFLTGLAFFPEFRQAVGIQLPITNQ